MSKVEVKEAVMRADRESMDATTDITKCPYPVDHKRPVPSNRTALAEARRLMKRHPGTEFASLKVGGQWYVKRFV